MRKWKWIWITWLVTLGVLDYIADRDKKSPKPRTFTEHMRAWFPKGWKRAVLVTLLVLLTLHLTGAIPDVKPMEMP